MNDWAVPPSTVVWGTAGFLAVLAAHTLIWRRAKPPREMAWLVGIFLVLPALAYLGILVFNGDIWRLLLAFIWHTALSSAYIMTYPPIQAGCPSLRIILEVHRQREKGLSREEIIGLFPPESMFSDRFDDLVEEGLISWQYDAWGISGTGRLLARFFLAYRRILKLPLGEG